MDIYKFPRELQNPIKLSRSLKDKPEIYWMKRGERRALWLFHQMAQRVPAYKHFLRKHKIEHEKIKTIEDFRSVPTIDKDNYLRSYPRKALCWDGEFTQQQWTVSSTSGSTGAPYYFPRQDLQDEQYALTAELYLRENFHIHKKRTLYIVGFPMGAWIGGLFTYSALKILSARSNYQLSIITPGINTREIINAVKTFGKEFEQVIIGSYAPFLKDVIDEGLSEGLDWKRYNLGFIFSAEAFNETFRDYVIEKAGLKNPYTSTLNHYGTVDLGTMSHETPIAVLMRRMAIADKRVYGTVFPNTQNLPTLTQFLPELFYFEEAEGNLICSAFSGLPLVRYDLRDHGAVCSLESMLEKFHITGVNILSEAGKAGIRNTVWNLPFVYVYERSDFSVSFFAFQIYPETVRKALQDAKLHKSLTGKFTMRVRYNRAKNQYFEVNVELKARAKKSERLKKNIAQTIMRQLLADNSEYRKTYEEHPKRVIPRVVLWPYEHAKYFNRNIKHKWSLNR